MGNDHATTKLGKPHTISWGQSQVPSGNEFRKCGFDCYRSPPFNKGRDFHATPDSLAAGAKFQDRWSWERDVHDDWLDQLQDDHPAVWAVIDWSRMTYGDDMGAFLCFMAVRLLEMHRVLKQTGSLYLHCDPTASHYLKTLLDAVFGKRNFRNEIIWYYGGPARLTDHFPRKKGYMK